MLDLLILIGIIIGAIWLILFAVKIVILMVAFIQDKIIDVRISSKVSEKRNKS